MAKYCTKCKKEIPDGSDICLNCGEPVKRRGRPRKDASTQPKVEIKEEIKSKEVIESEPVKKRGRPRKTAVLEENKETSKTENDTKEITKRQPTKRKTTTNNTKQPTSSSKKIGGKVVFPIIVVGLLLFVAFVKPGFLKKKQPTITPPIITMINVDQSDDSTETPLPEKEGNSKPLSYSPREGFYIEAKADAFMKDTEFTIEPIDSVSGKKLEAVQNLVSEGLYPIYAYEIDGGMRDDEITPGEYQVTIDLSLTELDKDLYSCVEIYRIAEDGTYYECASEVKDGKITYRAEQNSVIMTIVNSRLVARGYKLWFEKEFNPVSYYNGRKYYKGKNKHMTYQIDWVNHQLGIDMSEQIKRTEELVDKYNKEIEADIKYNLNSFLRNAQSINSIKQKLEANPEFKELEAALETPKEIQTLINSIDLGMEYLVKVEKIRTPTGVVKIHAVDYLEDKYADAQGKTITVALKYALDQGKTGTNNLMLTMTHELLHVCQRRYRFINPLIYDGSNDSVKFDEMVAGYVEARALNYFTNEEIFESDAIPTATNKNQWNSLKFPIDKEYTSIGASTIESEDRDDYFKDGYVTTEWDPEKYDFKDYINRVMINEGYNLAYFVNYICKDKQKVVTGDELMRARDWANQTGISKPLKKVFGLNEVGFRKYYKEFINSYREVIRLLWTSEDTARWYKTYLVTKIKPGTKQYVTFSCEGDYSTDVHTFRASTNKADEGKGHVKDPMSILIVPDDDFQTLHPLCMILPVEEYTRTNNGMLVGPLEYNREKNAGNRSIIEIHTNETEDAYLKNTGYNVYFFGKTCQIKPKFVSGKLTLTIIDESEAYKDQVIDGYVLTINIGGSEMTTDLSLNQINTPITINSKELYNKLSTYNDGKVKVCPYVLSAEGKKLFVEESDEVSLPKIEIENPPVVEDKIEDIDPIYKQGYKVKLNIDEMYDSDYWIGIARELDLKAELEIFNTGEFTFKMPSIPIVNYKKGNFITNGEVPEIIFTGSLRDGKVSNGYQYSISLEKEGCVEPVKKDNQFKYSKENTKLHTTWSYIEVERLDAQGYTNYHVPKVLFNISENGEVNFLIQMSSVWEFTEIRSGNEQKTSINSFATDCAFGGHAQVDPDDFDWIVKSVDYAITNEDFRVNGSN